MTERSVDRSGDVPQITYRGCDVFPPRGQRTAEVLISELDDVGILGRSVRDTRIMTAKDGQRQTWEVLGDGGKTIARLVFYLE